jgi:hypothetical protein
MIRPCHELSSRSSDTEEPGIRRTLRGKVGAADTVGNTVTG